MTATPDDVVIVGAGHAGGRAAEVLRERRYAGRITLVGDEPHLPYERPPLSKGFLLGSEDRASMDLHDEAWYADQGIDVRLGVPATEIDRSARTVTLADGSRIGYDRLLLTPGSRPRRLGVPGGDADGVYYLRRVDDSRRLRTFLTSASRVVVVGGGWIGLEVAAAARTAGATVTVLEAAERPLLGVLGPEVAEIFARLHTDHGVDLRTNVQVTEIRTSAAGRADGVLLSDGTLLEADGVVVGIGAEPNVELAAAADLDVSGPDGGGVLVDASLRTGDPAIWAAGDVARAYHPVLERRVRHEHWSSAVNQPPVAVTGMLGGQAAYAELPYFFTDQYDLGMEMYGAVERGGYDRVVFRGDVAGLAFAAFWLRDDRPVAGLHVNLWDLGEPLKALIEAGSPVDPDQLADTDAELPG